MTITPRNSKQHTDTWACKWQTDILTHTQTQAHVDRQRLFGVRVVLIFSVCGLLCPLIFAAPLTCLCVGALCVCWCVRCVCVCVSVCWCVVVSFCCLRTQTEWLDAAAPARQAGRSFTQFCCCALPLCVRRLQRRQGRRRRWPHEMNAYSMSNEIRDTIAALHSQSVSLSDCPSICLSVCRSDCCVRLFLLHFPFNLFFITLLAFVLWASASPASAPAPVARYPFWIKATLTP